MHTACHFSCCEKMRDCCLCIFRDCKTAHKVVGSWSYLHRLSSDVHSKLQELMKHNRKSGFNLFCRKMCYIKIHSAGRSPSSFQNFCCNPAGYDVSCRKLHPCRVILFHEAFAKRVFENSAFTSYSFRDKPASGIYRIYSSCRVELNLLHIDEFSSCPKSKSISITSAGSGVSCHIIELTSPACRENHSISSNYSKFSVSVNSHSSNHSVSVF